MFGYESAFVNGNMFAGTFQESLVVRQSDDERLVVGAGEHVPVHERAFVAEHRSPCDTW